MNKITIIVAVLDTQQLTLYKEDGDTFVIPQGDARIRPILDQITVPLSRNEKVSVDLEQTNHYKEFEEKTSGVVKFFRVLKKSVAHIFGDSPTEAPHEPPVTLGSVLQPKQNPESPVVQDAVKNEKVTTNEAVDQIMKQAKPVSAPDYKDSETTEDHTIVAVVDDVLIPGMENLKPQFARAVKLGSTEGATNFLKRIAKVIGERGHSIDDLLRFMERADLPIADDGSIISYKVLRSAPGKTGYFVDCHSRKVLQRVGSYVCMAEEMVDPNRRHECSNGLHIARRGYLGSFNGDVIVMTKMDPEAVIAVPSYDANKVRVCGYHILAEIPKDEHANLRSNQPISGSQTKKLLTKALRGDHIKRIEEVRITEQLGGGLKITVLDPNAKAPVIEKETEESHSLDDVKHSPSKADPKAVAETVTKVKAATPAPEPVKAKEPAPKVEEPTAIDTSKETRAQKIVRLVDNLQGPDPKAAAKELMEIKNNARKSWDTLNIPKTAVVMIDNLLSGSETEAKPVKVEKKAKTQVKQVMAAAKKSAPEKRSTSELKVLDTETMAKTGEVKVKKQKPKPKKVTAKPEPKLVSLSLKELEVATSELSRNQKAKYYLQTIENIQYDETTHRLAYQQLIDLKKKSKVGWMQLGVDNYDELQAKFEK